MNIQDIIQAINAEVVVKGKEKEIDKVFAGDRISDLIHNADDKTLIITHLNHISLIQLFQIFDVPAICLITDAEPIQELIVSAEKKEAYLIISPVSMYETCGMIYTKCEWGQTEK